MWLGLAGNGQLAALKAVPLHGAAGRPGAVQELVHEIGLLASLRDDYIVDYYGAAVREQHLYIVMEYMPGGSVAQLIRPEQFRCLPLPTVRRYSHDMVAGLSFLHSRRPAAVIHRDLKPGNVLLHVDGNLKLSDFGTTKADALIDGGRMSPYGSPKNVNPAPEIAGTPLYFSPEAVMGDVGPGLDIWALGVTVAEMIGGEPPFPPVPPLFGEGEPTTVHEMEAIAIVFRIGQGQLRPVPPAEVADCAEAVQFLAACWEEDAAARPNADKLLDHPFLVGGDDDRSPPSSSSLLR